MEVNLYILDLDLEGEVHLNVGFVGQWPSRMQGPMSFSQVGRACNSFRSGPENENFLDGLLPLPDSNSPKMFMRGSLTSSGTCCFKGSFA